MTTQNQGGSPTRPRDLRRGASSLYASDCSREKEPETSLSSGIYKNSNP